MGSSLHKTRRTTTFFGKGECRECSRGHSRASLAVAAAPGDGLVLVLSSWCRRSRPRLRLLDIRFSPWLSHRGVTCRSEEDGMWEALELGALAEEPQLLAPSGALVSVRARLTPSPTDGSSRGASRSPPH